MALERISIEENVPPDQFDMLNFLAATAYIEADRMIGKWTHFGIRAINCLAVCGKMETILLSKDFQQQLQAALPSSK